jgi:hypothetical protein
MTLSAVLKKDEHAFGELLLTEGERTFDDFEDPKPDFSEPAADVKCGF